MAENREIDLNEILNRLEFLEKENVSLREEVTELKNNDIEFRNEINVINRFIAALTECQTVEEVMMETESVARQITGSENATFYCMDSASKKFFSEDEGRSWQTSEENKVLKDVFDSQEISENGDKTYIPLVAENGRSLGVVVTENRDNECKFDIDRVFAKGGSLVGGMQLGLLKEYEHQGRITDRLTQMYNRQGLDEYLVNTVVKAMSEGKSVNILMSDIDHFKNVNDTYGHTAGDIILQSTADAIKDIAKEGASSCFRIGGEEMVTVLITDTPEQAIDMAETLRRNVEEIVNTVEGKDRGVHDVSVSISIGIHEMKPDVPFTKENAEALFDTAYKTADAAAYTAKETGRNKVVCADEQNYVSYLAMKTAEVFVKAEGLEAPDAIKGIEEMISDSFANPTEEQGLSDIIDALRTYAVQTSENMPDISALADFIADKAEEFSEKKNAVTIAETNLTDLEQDNRTQGENVFDVMSAATPETLISVEQNGCVEYMKTDKPIEDIILCCAEDKPFKAISDMAGEHISEADFASENQSRNTLAVEINIDENTLTVYNNDFTANIPLDKAVADITAVFPKELPYYTTDNQTKGNTFAEKVAAMKEWAEKTIEKVKEASLKRDEVAR